MKPFAVRFALVIPLALALGSIAQADITQANLSVYSSCTSQTSSDLVSMITACNHATTKLALSAQAALDARNMTDFSHLYMMGANCMTLEGEAEARIGQTTMGANNLTAAARAFRRVIRLSDSALDIRQAHAMLGAISSDYGGDR